jgi:hypothetical protein
MLVEGGTLAKGLEDAGVARSPVDLQRFPARVCGGEPDRAGPRARRGP